ncbi:hypothetical protein BRCON_0319 [Candidatus Sumerlaea chitinivorans]|uniref:Uncharacterized protein n=1 Tax=Sumerlaea chitinivorans TaxID=2250252 RepID=A0A2Z4Y2G3_SUMC1|nr:hypothetical protein BRCON_0319 [Candidatus Sumerlaea chitinivorans]
MKKRVGAIASLRILLFPFRDTCRSHEHWQATKAPWATGKVISVFRTICYELLCPS